VTGVILGPSFGGSPTAIFGLTPALVIGLGAALLTGMIVSLLHAWLSITVKADQIISGTIINIAAVGVTGYLFSLLAPSSPVGAGSFQLFHPPAFLTSLPFVGWIFQALFNQGPITISLVFIVIVLQIMLFRTRWGLRTRSVGEHPKAAETVGVDVVRLRYRNVVAAGTLAALGGAVLSMETTSSFQTEMTAGRGFIGLAAMIVGRWTPLGAVGAALLFASSQSISLSIQFVPPTGELGDLLTSLPKQFYDALPYIITIIVLTGLIGRSTPPAADGRPYEREAAT
jgi:simple sugar transport system permease protein